MELEQFLESLKGIEGAQEFFNSHTSVLSEEAKKHRLGKTEAKTKAIELDSTLGELLRTLQANNKDEAIDKISGFEGKLSEALKSVDTLKESYANEQKEKEKALLLSEVTEAIANKKLDDSEGIIRDAMLMRAKKDDDSGSHLIGDKNFSDFLQGQIDAETPTFTTKTKTEIPPTAPAEDTATVRDIMGLPPEKE